jgi:hypothetical protein
MRTSVAAILASAAIAILHAPGAAAHTVTYAGFNDCGIVGSCLLNSAVCITGFGVGVACLPAGDVQPYRSDGAAYVEIWDDWTFPVAGFVCQDTNADGLCGGGGELGLFFCHFTWIEEGSNWIQSQHLYVFIGGSSTASTFCGLGNVATGTQGYVDHS